jgi:hypothetical protein
MNTYFSMRHSASPFTAPVRIHHESTDHLSLHKRPFTDEEDETIRRFVYRNGAKDWTLLASELDDRTAKQCRERWHNHIDPSIDKGPWSEEEDQLIAEKHATLGNRWAEIARFLPGRTDALVKNRWNTAIRGRVSECCGSVVLRPMNREEQRKADSDKGKWLRANIGQWLNEWEEGRPTCVGLSGEWIPPLVPKGDR